ncbi:FliI/YscN family ATPase [Aestuariibius sp. 2305UL40-4]|uniref:FliI/YscN family ATPase n=1 Tax=Aestuariibius violaceus TaxID=3234132 RepID=UPI00345E642F
MSELARLRKKIETAQLRRPVGRIVEIRGSTLKASIPSGRIGEICSLREPGADTGLLAEIVGLADETAILSPRGAVRGLSLRTEVIPTSSFAAIPLSDALLGRVVDGDGAPLDGGASLSGPMLSIDNDAPDPLARAIIRKPFACGIRSIDGLLTCGEGQRIGIYGEAGDGKSTLMSAIVKGCVADVCVIGMIGERGREVREFVEDHLGAEAMAKSVVVAATSDRPAGERVAAAFAATRIAEHFRDQGKRVLLLMDSLTRFARAQREIGLAAGEMPTRRGFPISVFTMLPGLLERAGTGITGSITAFYTVLVEGDGTDDPIADETRGILDGHLVLSAKLASQNHYPAIDVLRSKSRVMNAVVDAAHRDAAGRVRDLIAAYADVELLVKVGEYQAGADPRADAALAAHEAIGAFLRQGTDEWERFDDSVVQLAEIAS